MVDIISDDQRTFGTRLTIISKRFDSFERIKIKPKNFCCASTVLDGEKNGNDGSYMHKNIF
jgi:hypothetical protein